MRRIVVSGGVMASLASFLLLADALAQPPFRVLTRPALPSREVLGRLSLVLHWHMKAPLENARDGFMSVQLIPVDGGNPQLVVQTLAGKVSLHDAETGDLLWRTDPGVPYWAGTPVGFNDDNIFVVRRDQLYVLNRLDGKHRVFTLDRDSKLPKYGVTLAHAPSAAPVADQEALVISMGNRVAGYEIPNWSAAEKALKGPANKALSAEEHQDVLEKLSALQPIFAWVYQDAVMHVDHAPMLAGDQAAVVTTSGHLLSLKKYERGLRFDYETQGAISAGPGKHGVIAYVGSHDLAVYAINMVNERLVWRFLAGAPVLVKPAVTDQDVFVGAHKRGLFRVDRLTGRDHWLNKDADRFLAANEKFVYAIDRTKRLLVLDYARGTSLAAYDARDWTIHLPNELTDRIYLASHDGQIVCLRHRDHVTPLKNKTILDVKKKPGTPAEEKKKDEPKDDAGMENQ